MDGAADESIISEPLEKGVIFLVFTKTILFVVTPLLRLLGLAYPNLRNFMSIDKSDTEGEAGGEAGKDA